MAIFGQNTHIMAGWVKGSGNCINSHITSNYIEKHLFGPFVPSKRTLVA